MDPIIPNVADFATRENFNGVNPQAQAQAKIARVSFASHIDPAEHTYQANVLKGTFDLVDRVQNLETREADLVQARSTGSRLKRAGIALLAVAVVTGLVAAMVFGGEVGLVLGGLGLLVGGIGADVALCELLFGRPLEKNLLFLITAPIFFVYYLWTYESKRATKVENARNENAMIAQYVENNYDRIKGWLTQAQNKTIAQITNVQMQLKEGAANGVQLARIGDDLKRLGECLTQIQQHIVKLDESYNNRGRARVN